MPELIVPDPKNRRRLPFETPEQRTAREAWEREVLRLGCDPGYLDDLQADAESGEFEP